MPRIVRHDALGPLKIDPATIPPGKMIFVCACGLSKSFPLCDGTHKGCVSESPDRVYAYDPATGVRHEVTGPHGPA